MVEERSGVLPLRKVQRLGQGSSRFAFAGRRSPLLSSSAERGASIGYIGTQDDFLKKHDQFN